MAEAVLRDMRTPTRMSEAVEPCASKEAAPKAPWYHRLQHRFGR